MKTYLPVGSWIEYRHRGEIEKAEIIEGDSPDNKHIRLYGTPPHGTTIHVGVWKRDGEFKPIASKQYTYNAPR
jgi:hypothetical protein